jgi:hypothetical protein
MTSKKEKTVLIQARIPLSLAKKLEERMQIEMCSMSDVVRRALAFTEIYYAKMSVKKVH